jgi:hypothetical protein
MKKNMFFVLGMAVWTLPRSVDTIKQPALS